MALTNNQISQTPSYTDQPYFNYTGTDIPANVAVAVDATNQVAGTNQSQGIGVKPVGSTGDPVIGVTMEILSAGNSGRVRCLGPIAQMSADGAITAGTYVDASSTALKVGFAKAHTSAKATIGIALASATSDGDPIPVMLVGGLNA